MHSDVPLPDSIAPRRASTRPPRRPDPEADSTENPAVFLAMVLENVQESIIATDLQGRVLYWNEGAAGVFGYTAAEMVGRTVADLTTVVLQGKLERDLARILAGETLACEWGARRKDGTEIWIDLRGTAMRDRTGRVVGFLGVGREATERRRVEEALRRQEARFRLLIERTPDTILVHRYGPIVYANPAALACFGYTEAELLGRSIWDLVHPDERSGVEERERRLSQTGVANAAGELRLLRRDGTVVSVEFSALPVDFDDQPAVVCVARDVSRERAMHAHLMMADRLISVGTMAAGVAHEINNPLAYVISNLSYAIEELSLGRPDGALEALRDADEGAGRVSNIIRKLKVFSHPDAEVVQAIELQPLLRSSVAIVWNEISNRAKLVTHFGDVPPVLGNQSRLGQVLVNLLVNAAQAIPEGSADQHEIRLVTRTDALGRAVVEVGDTGCGIPRADMGRIFDPFFTTKPIGVGPGLGLSICHVIVTSLGGHIDVESELGVGTTFRITLPASAIGPERRTPSESAMLLPAPHRRGRVLVIDDEPMVGAAIGRMLARSHDACVVGSAHAAIERLDRGERFDVVLCDLMMPGMSGMDLYQELAGRLPEVAWRMIFLTGGAFTESARRFLEQVHNPCLHKPFEVDGLRAIVARMVDTTAAPV